MFKNLLKRNLVGTSQLQPSQPAASKHAVILSESSTAPALEALQSHWRQAVGIIKRTSDPTRPSCTLDDVQMVVELVERMSELVVNEREENSQQGHCLVYMLTEDIINQLVTWCLQSGVYENRIKYELLKILENMISQSIQPLLYHKPVIGPLLRLLSACDDTGLEEIEKHVILLLHQLCVCISRNPQYLELFFNVSYTSGQGNFLIFCLLIPYIHREGSLGQQARDALLLIMAASTRNQVIGKYIANNSDFCPVLATGLSALYSSLPHKVRPDNVEDWYRIEKEHYLHMPDIQMIINCLEFCNAVVQVAHVLVGQQLIDFIYNGFLLPVMAPALLQSAIEEQVSAIAYLELFVRTVTEPSLLRAFLHFILTTKHDNIVILEWLIERISSSTKLCMVSLSLFKTLIELNCEDVMFALCFRYLYRLTHVMQSQKRGIKELDIYGKIADKILQLEPKCCQEDLTEEQQKDLVSFNDGFSTSTSEYDFLSSLPFNFPYLRGRVTSSILSIFTQSTTLTQPSVYDYKSCYMDYLCQAKFMIRDCVSACTDWCYPYDGELPPYNATLTELHQRSENNIPSSHRYDTPDPSLVDDVSLLNLGIDSPFSSPIKPHFTNRPDEPLIQISDLDTTAPTPTRDVTALLDLPVLAEALQTQQSKVDEDDAPLLDLENTHLVTLSTIHTGLPDTTDGSSSHTKVNSVNTSDRTVLDSVEDSSSDAHTEPVMKGACSTTQGTSRRSVTDYDSFLDYLDDSTDLIQLDPNKSGLELLEEVETMINSVESLSQRLQSNAASTISSSSPIHDASSSPTDTGNAADVDTQPQPATTEPIGSDSPPNFMEKERVKRKLRPEDVNLKLDESVDSTPNIGPFLTALLQKLENMMNNSLAVNLLLTGLVTRIACYPQPLLRSFLLSSGLMLKPSVKCLIQVLTSVKHKARKIMVERADFAGDDHSDEISQRSKSSSVLVTEFDVPEITSTSSKSPAKKKLADFFKRDKNPTSKSGPVVEQPDLVKESTGYRFTKAKVVDKKFESPEARLATINTKKAVYCALVLEEFVKELAALSQEHAVQSDEGYQTE